jgi:hypothetical protein
MMHPLKSVASLLHDDADQMDHRVAALHAFLQPRTFDYVTVDPLEVIFAPEMLRVGDHTRLLSRQAPQRGTHGMAFSQQSFQHVLADEAGRAGEEDFHGVILNVRFFEVPNPPIFAGEGSLWS